MELESELEAREIIASLIDPDAFDKDKLKSLTQWKKHRQVQAFMGADRLIGGGYIVDGG